MYCLWNPCEKSISIKPFKFTDPLVHNISNSIQSLLQLYERLPQEERIILDILRQIVLENIPPYCKEKMSFNVPYFYGHKGICIIWPASIPRGGIKEGVLLGFWQGNQLMDLDGYLTHGSNKKVFYKIFRQVAQIDETAIVKLLKEAVDLDKKNQFKP